MAACLNCDRKVVARGYCLRHYKAAVRTGEVQPQSSYGAGLQFLRSLPSDLDDCIEYPFGRFPSGYGHIKVAGHGRPAHVVAYELHHGPVTPGMEVCHNCGNRPCVNPRHLRQDTHRGNMADCVGHGTHTRGERNGRARLTNSQVEEIRRRAAIGEIQLALASEFSVSPATVNHIVRGRTWNTAAA